MRHLFAVSLALALAVGPAETSTWVGTVAGTVVDREGGALPGATVTLLLPSGPRKAMTDARGAFRFDGVPSGQYSLRAELSGFQSVEIDVAVQAGRVTAPVIALRIAGLEELVTVSDGRGKAHRMAPPPLPAKFALSQAPREMNTEAYRRIDENVFVSPTDRPLSTVSIDVDTASYSNVRRFLMSNQLPPPDAVRVEELLNYFRYDYPDPAGAHPIAVDTEVAACPWAPEHLLVRIGLQARRVKAAATPARNLVFLVDVSGSMNSWDKLPLVKAGLKLLVSQLRPQDRVAVVVYAGASGLALPSTPGDRQADILAAIDALESGGSTNGGAGIALAYKVAQEHFVAGGINRVVLATDGDFNVGVTSEGDLVRLIEEKRKSGVFLSVLGFGTGNLKDSTMEMLADRGDGNFAYVDSLGEARRVLVTEGGGTLVTVARDVKVQVEWNPARVARYRLLGYENRVLADQAFEDDKVDAGEAGSGQSVTFLYEVVPADGSAHAERGLRYQSARSLEPAAESDELMSVKVRYKAAEGGPSRALDEPVLASATAAEASPDLRFSAAVAAFGMVLRGSPERGQASYALATQLATEGQRDGDSARREFLDLVGRAQALSAARAAATR